MAIWNVYDTKLISDICGTVEPTGEEIPPKKGHDVSVSTYVRKKASKTHLKMRKQQQGKQGEVDLEREESPSPSRGVQENGGSPASAGN